MSSRSPRNSFSGASSMEVAADFEDSLKDLQINNRYEISNLTIIAKENTEHAQAISRALENHIKSTSPSRKLPALYVLDSIVKNVGTPYTTYLGLNLFKTFMDAYTLVDSNTRRAMEGMLKTWKEPVPGSIDMHPVFSLEVVRPIENALLRAKTAALQSQRPQQAQALRSTLTPPQQNGRYATPPVNGANSYAASNMNQYNAPTPQPQYAQQPPQTMLSDVDSLRRDLAALVARDQNSLATSMHDASLRTRLMALLDLQKVLNTRALSPAELQAIRAQVAQLSAITTPQHLQIQPTPQPVPAPQWSPPPQIYQPPTPHYPPSFMPTPQPPQAQPTVPNFSPEALSGLQALLASTQKPSTPQMRAAVPSFQNAGHSQLNAIQNHVSVAPPAAGAGDLLASLAKAGLLKSPPNPVSTPIPPPTAGIPPPDAATASLLRSLQGVLPPPTAQDSISTPQSSLIAARLPITQQTLKTLRPELIASLYDARPNQCSICGRRFLATEEGRQLKSRHLDWHFRMNQRIADPNTNRGHHRNWYLDEMDWITHVDFDPSTTTAEDANAAAAAATGGSGAGAGGGKGKGKLRPQDQFVKAPPGMTKNTCSICFEEMKSSYSEELQDWIFGNATVHNGRIVHATCLAEMNKGGGSAASGTNALAAALAAATSNAKRERSATPDSALGKRKAEVALLAGSGQRARIE